MSLAFTFSAPPKGFQSLERFKAYYDYRRWSSAWLKIIKESREKGMSYAEIKALPEFASEDITYGSIASQCRKLGLGTGIVHNAWDDEMKEVVKEGKFADCTYDEISHMDPFDSLGMNGGAIKKAAERFGIPQAVKAVKKAELAAAIEDYGNDWATMAAEASFTGPITAAKLSSRAGTFGLTERAQEVGAIKSKEKEAAQKAELAAAIQVFGTDWNKMVKAAPYNGRCQPQWLQRCAKSWGLLEEAKAVAMAKKDQELAFQKAELAAAVEVWGMDWAGMAAAAPYNGSLKPQTLSKHVRTFGLMARAQEVALEKQVVVEAAQKAELAAAIQRFANAWEKMAAAPPYNGSLKPQSLVARAQKYGLFAGAQAMGEAKAAAQEAADKAALEAAIQRHGNDWRSMAKEEPFSGRLKPETLSTYASKWGLQKEAKAVAMVKKARKW